MKSAQSRGNPKKTGKKCESERCTEDAAGQNEKAKGQKEGEKDGKVGSESLGQREEQKIVEQIRYYGTRFHFMLGFPNVWYNKKNHETKINIK